jgi:hypothetical protein
MHVRDGKISEAWIHIDDLYALDDFLNLLTDAGSAQQI